MSTTYFTSDTHFGHKKILGYCHRPFADIKEMDATLIANWNERVGPDDIIYHLGDFTLGGRTVAKKLFRQLNGHIRILSYPWHHDRGWHRHPMPTYLNAQGEPVTLLGQMDVIERNPATGDVHIALSHFPLAAWDRKHYGALHLHGHCHGDRPPDGKMWDVGVDPNDYRPITAAEALARIPEELKTVEYQKRHL